MQLICFSVIGWEKAKLPFLRLDSKTSSASETAFIELETNFLERKATGFF